MRIRVLLASLLVLAGSAAMPAPAESVGIRCGGTSLLVKGFQTSDAFSLTTCTDRGVGWRAVAMNGMGLEWTVRSAIASTYCNWGPYGPLVCFGPYPVPAPAGTEVDVSVAVFWWDPQCGPCTAAIGWFEECGVTVRVPPRTCAGPGAETATVVQGAAGVPA